MSFSLKKTFLSLRDIVMCPIMYSWTLGRRVASVLGKWICIWNRKFTDFDCVADTDSTFVYCRVDISDTDMLLFDKSSFEFYFYSFIWDSRFERKERGKLNYSFTHRNSTMGKSGKFPTKLLAATSIVLMADSML
jgi:hypothetical protein